ncbi:hypothetical protein FA95DRAFT_1607421 [Auriscalpium vulgare]|uniref:Uncharacterized protein n=1 Tax=Auriscalpium vulgare TaxID=40419 RepID=A0ACB8RPH7_9AGAM|nr:hypothetical protein FA95DRAFT_1607421 [Auriscalpium vulgare]
MSRLLGRLNSRGLPVWFRPFSFRVYAWSFSCNVTKFEPAYLGAYSSLDTFIYRKLARRARHRRGLGAPVKGIARSLDVLSHGLAMSSRTTVQPLVGHRHIEPSTPLEPGTAPPTQFPTDAEAYARQPPPTTFGERVETPAVEPGKSVQDKLAKHASVAKEMGGRPALERCGSASVRLKPGNVKPGNALYFTVSRGVSTLGVRELRGAVRITYDDLGHRVKIDDGTRDWSLHTYLEKRFPLILETLQKITVNTYALVYERQGSDSSLKPVLQIQTLFTVFPWTLAPSYFDGDWTSGGGSCDDKSGVIAFFSSCLLQHIGDVAGVQPPASNTTTSSCWCEIERDAEHDWRRTDLMALAAEERICNDLTMDKEVFGLGDGAETGETALP